MDEPPEKTSADIPFEITRAVVSAIPGAGGPLSVLMENVFQAPLQERLRSWLAELAETVEDLCEKVDRLSEEKLAANEQFISAAQQATEIALRSHQKEKREALRNALANIALEGGDQETEHQIFLRLIDELTPLHVQLLAFLDQAPIIAEELNEPSRRGRGPIVDYASFHQVWEERYPDRPKLLGSDLLNQVAMDLKQHGLVRQHNWTSRPAKVTTPWGEAFLAFIEKPEPLA